MISAALDATPLLGRRTGIGVAVSGYLEGLAGRDDVSVTGYGLTVRGAASLGAALPPGVRFARRPAPAGLLLRWWAAHDRPPAEWWTGPVDVVHGTNFVVPPSRRAARVVSVWDLTAVQRPDLCTPTARRYPALVARAVAGGAWVHTAAESVAAEVVEHFGVDPGRVRVVPPVLRFAGPGPGAGPVGPGPSAAGAPPPYLLAVGRTEPRKDLPTLVRAFDEVAGTSPELELRIAGPAGWGEEALDAAVAAAAHGRRIRRMGWVEDLATLVAGAEVFVYPSLYEGFGLPPLEAMALGVPVVAAAVGAVPEVVGDAAELVPPGDPIALAAAISRVVGDRARRAEMVAAGRRRVEQFSGADALDGLVRLYRDAVAAR